MYNIYVERETTGVIVMQIVTGRPAKGIPGMTCL